MLVFKDGGKGRTGFTLEDKAKVFDAMYNQGRGMLEVISELYKKYGKKLPRNPSMITPNWKRAFKNGVAANDPEIIALCKKYNLLEEREEWDVEDDEEEVPPPATNTQ
jgi:hypothetical protein